MSGILNLIRPDLQDFVSYSSARDEAKAGRLWLNANESPYELAFESIVNLNRYPEKQPSEIIEKIATLFKVRKNQLILTRGSDEAIDLLVRLFCIAGKDSIISCPPTYGMYSVSARLQGASIIEIPLIKEKGFQLDLPTILSAKEKNPKIIFLCSPNNPTGNLLRREDILALCKTYANKSLIVIDEAYIDFANEPSLASSIDEFENLAILRTFSKAHGMAGARLGVLLANEGLIQWLLKIIAPYPLPAITNQLLENVLSKNRALETHTQIASIKSERQRIHEALEKLPFIKKVWSSQANYILALTENSDKIMKICAENGIIIRSMFDKKGLENCIRISVGLPEENSELLKVLQEVA